MAAPGPYGGPSLLRGGSSGGGLGLAALRAAGIVGPSRDAGAATADAAHAFAWDVALQQQLEGVSGAWKDLNLLSARVIADT